MGKFPYLHHPVFLYRESTGAQINSPLNYKIKFCCVEGLSKAENNELSVSIFNVLLLSYLKPTVQQRSKISDAETGTSAFLNHEVEKYNA